jgi:hypothetical protein
MEPDRETPNPDPKAQSLYAQGVACLSERGIPMRYLRVFWWPDRREGAPWLFDGTAWQKLDDIALQLVLASKHDLGAFLRFGSRDEAKEYGYRTIVAGLVLSQDDAAHYFTANGQPKLDVSNGRASISLAVKCRYCKHVAGFYYQVEGRVPLNFLHQLGHYRIEPPEGAALPACRRRR